MSKFSELATPLAEKFRLTQKEAENFLSLMTDVLNDGLRDEKQVKVRGLGTFKVTAVSARKSVNVKTGEPMVIEGREKIAFTPDTTLKERVNSPFAQFETVVVNDDVDFSEIDRKYAVDKDSVDKDSAHATQEESVGQELPSPAPIEEAVDEEQTIAASAVQAVAVSEENVPMEEPEETATEEKQEPDELDVEQESDEQEIEQDSDEQEIERESDEQIVEQESDEQEIEKELPAMAPVLSAEKEEVMPESESEPEPDAVAVEENISGKDSNRRLIYGTVALLLLLVVFGTFYFMRDAEQESVPAQPARMEKKEKAAAPAPAAKEKKTMEAASQGTNSAGTNSAPAANPQAKNDVANAQPAPTPDYNAYPVLRYGAYEFDGVAAEVTVRKGQTLASISKTYLGPGAELYVEAFNGKKVVKEGDVVKIPKLVLKNKKKKNGK